MNQFKRAQVIVLPHNDINTIITKYIGAKLLSRNLDILAAHTNQHLYIISDDEKKEGDWTLCLDEIDSTVMNWNIKQCVFKHTKGGNCTQCKKIITTTDTSLGYNQPFINPSNNKADNKWVNLPQPSQQFIEKYIESYNKGEIITDVLVEYENNLYEHFGSGKYHEDKPVIMKKFLNKEDVYLKINPTDNTITIKKLKESWNRDEVITVLNKLNNTLNIGSDLTLKQWIEKNL